MGSYVWRYPKVISAFSDSVDQGYSVAAPGFHQADGLLMLEGSVQCRTLSSLSQQQSWLLPNRKESCLPHGVTTSNVAK